MYVDGERLALCMNGNALLHFFVRHAGETLSRERLLCQVCKYERRTPTRTADVHVGWLRKKVKDDPRNPRWVRTVYGIGCQFAQT